MLEIVRNERVRTVLVTAAIGIVGYWVFHGLIGDQTVSAQSDMYLSRRIDQVEQRFYSLESRLNRVEQDAISRRSVVSPQIATGHETDIAFLRTSVDGIRARLGEVECGLLKLDERTLPAARRLAGKATGGSERCRQDWGTAIQLSARP